MKTGLAVVVFLIVVSGLVAWGLARKYGPELTRTQDLVTGLIYFLEENQGRFPASESEFLASSFIEKLPDGFRIRPRPSTRFRGETHGVMITDLKPFEIAWGTDLSRVKVDDRGRVRNEKGDEIKLISWPSSPPSGRSYSWVLLDVYEQITGPKYAPATLPATLPVTTQPTAP